ncbi:hypothetical protein [Streptomyces sp. CO7]
MTALLAPLVVVAVLLGFLLLKAYGPGASWFDLVGVAVAFVLAGHFLFRDLLSFVPTALVLWSLVLITGDFEALVLESRGREVTCEVLEKTSRTVTSTSTDAQGHITATTTTTFHFRLSCPGGSPREMTWAGDVGRQGRRLRIRYDPQHRLAPRPVADGDARGLRFPAGLIAGAMVIGAGIQLQRRRTY